jgi:hypothetical protein
MNCKYELQFGQIEMTEAYTVFTANEGINLDNEEITALWAILKKNYGENKFGFIAHRINSYSINPLAIRDFFLNENIIAGAIVSKTEKDKSVADYERMFVIKAQTQNFTNLEPAIDWVEKIVGGDSK